MKEWVFLSEQVKGHRIGFKEEVAVFTSRQLKLAGPVQLLWLISHHHKSCLREKMKKQPTFPKSILKIYANFGKQNRKSNYRQGKHSFLSKSLCFGSFLPGC